ncbi:hypothetical protein CV133_gene7 [Chlorobiaceae phage CV-1-33]|nr:DUF3440 domain-containing protein [Chlorobiaceae bacterium]QOE32014.1 hypothetical protein CV133_gene7 [Chlorobiaceae phage CV-1-33]
MPTKKVLGKNVFVAAIDRVNYIFDNFPKIYVSFSGGKDSSVMTHIVASEARRRGVKIGLLCVDLEAQYRLTMDHVAEMYEMYADVIEPYWVALPLNLRNAVSQYMPQWKCWDVEKADSWVRNPPKIAITETHKFPFFHDGMEFEEFVPAFGKWYSEGKPCACFVGIRSDESLNRWRTISGGRKQMSDGHKWTTWIGDSVFNAYPIYDWKTEDLWTFSGKTGLPYNKLYDRMYQAGLTLHQMRICQPYGDDQRKGLWLFHIIEPETWGKVIARVNGANQGALYAQESGNVLGNRIINKPDNHTWKSFAFMLLDSMPDKTGDHYKDKIAVFLKWYSDRGYERGIPDDGPMDKSAPCWKRVCKALLRNDYWCKGLSFGQHKSEAYEKYKKLMRKRRSEWGII